MPAGRILIDGTRSGEVGDEVLRDRRHLAGDGLVVPVVTIGRQSGALEETPDVITRGFVLDARTEALLREIPTLLAATLDGGQRRGTNRSGTHQGEDSRGPAAVLPKAFGAAAAGAAGRDGDLTWPESSFSRRLSEFIGVALFALALIWLISLGELQRRRIPSGSSTPGPTSPPANFAGRIGAFMAELSYQLLGYAAYLVPPVLVVARLALLLVPQPRRRVHETGRRWPALRLRVVVPVARVRHGADTLGKTFRAGGYLGERLAAMLAAYLNRTGSIILILTLLFLAIILSTQFSFGRLFAVVGQMLRDRVAALFGLYREWRDQSPARQAASGSDQEAPRQGAQGPEARSAAADCHAGDGVARCCRGETLADPPPGSSRATKVRRNPLAPPRWLELLPQR